MQTTSKREKINKISYFFSLAKFGGEKRGPQHSNQIMSDCV